MFNFIFLVGYTALIFWVPAIAERQERFEQHSGKIFWHFIPLIVTPIPPLLFLLLTESPRDRRIRPNREYVGSSYRQEYDTEKAKREYDQPKCEPCDDEWNNRQRGGSKKDWEDLEKLKARRRARKAENSQRNDETRDHEGEHDRKDDAHTHRAGRVPQTERDEQYYAKILGLSGPTKPDEIRRAYKNLAKQYHPDKVHGLGIKLRELAEKEMKMLNEAYEFFKKKYKL